VGATGTEEEEKEEEETTITAGKASLNKQPPQERERESNAVGGRLTRSVLAMRNYVININS
jgi:hypothetical protein